MVPQNLPARRILWDSELFARTTCDTRLAAVIPAALRGWSPREEPTDCTCAVPPKPAF